MRELLTTLLLVCFAVGPVVAEEPLNAYLDLQRAAVTAYTAGDHETFLAKTLEALSLRPNSLAMRYNAACGYSLTGDYDRAMKLLEELAERGVNFGAEADPDLEPLKDRADFKQLMDRVRASVVPVNNSSLVYENPQVDIFAEGVTVDRRSGQLFVGSMGLAAIYAVDTAGNWHEFVRLQADNPMGFLGLVVDTANDILWAAATAFDVRNGFRPEHDGTTAVYGFDLQSGIEKYFLPYPKHHPNQGFNDLTITADGDMFLTGGGLYHIRPMENAPEYSELPVQFSATNGICLSPDQKTLYVSATIDGIAAVHLSDNSWEWVEHPDSIVTIGIDGLYFYNNSLLAIQNGIPPWRVVQFNLDSSGRKIVSSHILELGNPDLAQATTGALVDGQFWYLAMGHKPAILPAGIQPAQERWTGRVRIMSIDLK